MEEIITLVEIDWKPVIVAFVLLLCFTVGFLKALEYLATKFGIETKSQRDRKLLIKTSDNLTALQKQHDKDMEQSLKHDREMRETLSNFIAEMRETVAETQRQMKEYTENRVHDREQSFAIQKELTDSIKVVADGGKRREEQIEAVMIGNRELLGAEIDRRFDRYIEMGGIPSDELDEFISLHDAYKGCKGNHNRDAKFQYIIENLPVLPVESKLKNKN